MISIAVTLVGGMGLFIAGMYMMSHGIEKVAGSKLRSILETFTKSRLLGLFVGLFFTAVIQSSSAATVMVVTFVESGLMELSRACGIILGANIGTTVTAILVAFKLSAVAPLFIFAGAIMMNFIKNTEIKKSGEIVLGFGILFVGISTMSDAMASLREIPAVINFFAGFTNPFLATLLGLVITSVVQSSSVTVSILVVMASQGLVNLHLCMFVILGCNIGACTSAVLAGLGGSKNGMRAAMIHLLFNVFGSILIFILLILIPQPIENFIRMVSGSGTDSGSLGRNIAFTHLTFKIFQVIVFYPFMDWIIRLTYILVPGTDEKEENEFYTQYIGNTLPNPAVAIYFAREEIERMAQMASDNLNRAVEALCNNDDTGLEEIYKAEKYIDYLDLKISDYLVEIYKNAIPLEDANRIAAYFHVVNDIERIGDHAENVADMVRQFKQNNIILTPESAGELREMMALINRMYEKAVKIFVSGNMSGVEEVMELEDQVDAMEKKLLEGHILRLTEGKCSALAGVGFSDIVSGLERVADHTTTIAFSLDNAKGATPRELPGKAAAV